MNKPDYKAIADELAYIIYRMYEGDEVEGMEALLEHGYLDADLEWLYDEE